MGKRVNMGISPDTKDNKGNWKKVICIKYEYWETLSYRRWYSINNRCKINGSIQLKRPSYIGCTNEFKSFNDFVEWSRLQVGYDFEGYQLDKDLLVKDNKIYSPETCVFLPTEINNLILKSNSTRGEFPIGVHWDSRKSKFVSQYNLKGSKVHIGYFDCPIEAFNAYKRYKESLVKQIAGKYKDFIDIKAYNALCNYSVSIED